MQPAPSHLEVPLVVLLKEGKKVVPPFNKRGRMQTTGCSLRLHMTLAGPYLVLHLILHVEAVL
eukprot:1159340-Pelagomonas_calceolata.AAC.6